MTDSFNPKTVTVVGLGSVGLPYARYLAWSGHTVVGYDINEARLEHLKATTKFEPSYAVPSPLRTYTATPCLEFNPRLGRTEYYLVCVPTPSEDGHSLDTSAVESSVSSALELNPTACVVLKSTITLECLHRLEAKHQGASIVVAPEYLREGETEAALFKATSLVLGASKDEDFQRALVLLNTSTRKFRKWQISRVSLEEAVYSKVLHNAYLAMRVAFFNEVDSVCTDRGMNVRHVIDAVCLDPRIGQGYNNPSFGFGGTCLPKDLRYAEVLHEDSLSAPNLLSGVLSSNVGRQRHLVRQLQLLYPGRTIDVGVHNFHPSAISPKVELSSTEALVLRLLRAGKVRTLKVYSEDGTYAGVPESLLDKHELRLVTSIDEVASCDVVLSNRHTWLVPETANVFTKDLGKGN